MSLGGYLKKRLTDILEEKRVVVWYDGEQAFGEIADSFAAPGMHGNFLHGTPRLKARRRADEVMCQLNDAAGPSHEKNGSLLIYAPFRRGKTEEDRLQDAFEGFGVIGTAFGDKEGEGFQSLARVKRILHEPPKLTDSLTRDVRPFLLSKDSGKRFVIRYFTMPLVRTPASK